MKKQRTVITVLLSLLLVTTMFVGTGLGSSAAMLENTVNNIIETGEHVRQIHDIWTGGNTTVAPAQPAAPTPEQAPAAPAAPAQEQPAEPAAPAPAEPSENTAPANEPDTNTDSYSRISPLVSKGFLAGGAAKETYRMSRQYCIAVNTKQNLVIIYGKDEFGNYTKPVKSMACSCGMVTTPTVLGSYMTQNKYDWRLLGGTYGQYATRICGPYMFHSVPYYNMTKNSLLTDEYNKLGSAATNGGINLSVRDAKWIYDNVTLGTIVFLYSDVGIREPMSKPNSQRIDPHDTRAGWDPTDPDPSNPWK